MINWFPIEKLRNPQGKKTFESRMKIHFRNESNKSRESRFVFEGSQFRIKLLPQFPSVSRLMKSKVNSLDLSYLFSKTSNVHYCQKDASRVALYFQNDFENQKGKICFNNEILHKIFVHRRKHKRKSQFHKLSHESFVTCILRCFKQGLLIFKYSTCQFNIELLQERGL